MLEIRTILHPNVWYLPIGIAKSEAYYAQGKDNLLAISILCFSLVFEW